MTTAALYTATLVFRRMFLFVHRCLDNLPYAPVALAIREVISASIEALLLTVLPRYLKLSTAFNSFHSIVIAGASYIFPGAGWKRVSVFLMLIVKPNLEAAVAKQSHKRCSAPCGRAASAQSSASNINHISY